MALSNIEMVRVITQDNGNLPFLAEGDYILSDDEIESYLTLQNNDVFLASRMAAYSICLWIGMQKTKDMVGEVEEWYEAGKNYRNTLTLMLTDKSLFNVLPKGLMPYGAGVSNNDIIASLRDLDNPRRLSWLVNPTGYQVTDNVWQVV
jgi:hypothetical protein